MCRLDTFFVILVLLMTALFGTMVPAFSNSIGLDCGVGAGLAVVMDGGGLDANPAPNAVTTPFICMGPGWNATGTLIGITIPGISATTILTELVIDNVVGPPDPAMGMITFVHTFPAIGPPAMTTAALSGRYDDDSGLGFISFADIEYDPEVNLVPIGIINPPPAALVASPVPFAGASGPVGVAPATQHEGFLKFELGLIGDAIVLPDSAEIRTSGSSQPIPEPSTLSLIGIGVLGLLGYAYKWRRLVPSK